MSGHFLVVGITALAFLNAAGEVHFVDANNPNPQAPFTNWATAARTIQDAVDAAVNWDEIVVTNGIYASSARSLPGLMTSRVAVTNALTIRSVNGPAVTVIRGYQAPGTTNDTSAVRCVYLSSFSILSGFTLTDGATAGSGGGVCCSSRNAVVTNCVLSGNSATTGGGACSGMLFNCLLTGNTAEYGASIAPGCGGGAYLSALMNCTVMGNLAAASGGGVFQGSLYNCTVIGNSAMTGGGVASSDDSTLLNDCIVYYNNASWYDANISIGYGSANYSCTTPLPLNGVGNFMADPQLASSSHLSIASPCRGAGNASFARGVDIDGESWLNPPSVGCDEYRSGSVTGAVSVGIMAAYTNVATGFAVEFQNLIQGRVSASRWEFGDGAVASNRVYTSHAWTAAGAYEVILRAYNESFPDGVTATARVQVVERPVHYVSLTSGAPAAPYSSWATAATNLQDAVGVAAVAGALVLASNGVYETGGKVAYGSLTNRVAVLNPVLVQSVNGPSQTIIRGYQMPGTTNGAAAIRCVYLSKGAVLSGFTLSGGATLNERGPYPSQGSGGVFCESGGGAFCESPSATVTNCVLTGNSAIYGGAAFGGTLNNCTLTRNRVDEGWAVGGRGGGAFGAALNNCLLSSNLAVYGGGADKCTMNNCTLSGNSAGTGGGASSSMLNNSVIYYNKRYGYDDNFSDCTLNHCCTTPLPANGFGNFTNQPLFVNLAGADLRLQATSPCINAGDNAYVPGVADLDGNPRIVSGTADIGAYEYQGTGSIISYAWLQQYGLPVDGSADYTDPDEDGMNNWQEWRCLTDPTNARSALRLLLPFRAGTSVKVTWQSVAGVKYFVEASTNLVGFTPFFPVASGILGQAATTSYIHTNAPVEGPVYYRVGVGN